VVLIGELGEGEKKADLASLVRYKNMYYLGPRSYDILPRYLKLFDICLFPGRINEYTKNMFPLKFFEYLAAGKPVIATELPALGEFREYFYVASDKKDFVKKLNIALMENNPKLKQARINLASQYDWDSRMEVMSGLIENAWK
jgi:glycosyltransferase involved in cell wall biosynthesis